MTKINAVINSKTPKAEILDLLLKVQKEYTDFREQVVVKATEAATEHGWCTEVNEILKDLGLNPPGLKRKVILTFEIEVDAGEFGWDDDCYITEASALIRNDSCGRKYSPQAVIEEIS